MASVTVEHRRGTLSLRNHTQLANYDRFYQNFVPGAVTANKAQVALTAYNNATERLNFFNQTDVTSRVETGQFRHTLLAGAEFGPLQLAIWKKQFQALRDGDRFFYLNDPVLSAIRQNYGIDYRRTLADVITANTGVGVAANVFLAAD